jgi:hypothetical protein
MAIRTEGSAINPPQAQWQSFGLYLYFGGMRTKVILSLVGLALFVAEIEGKNVQEPGLVTAA